MSETKSYAFEKVNGDSVERLASPAEAAINSPVEGGTRWAVLFLACSLLFGNFYAYDTPAALNTELQKHLGSSDGVYQYQINLIYSVYALPNMFLPIFGGGFMDRFGTSSLMQLLSVVICVGHLFFSIGVQWRSLPLMIFGRVLFGIGGESLSVAQTRMTTKYFRGRELALALGVNLSVARLGSVANDLLSPYLAVKFSVPFAVYFGLTTCLLSLLCSFTLSRLDRRQGDASVTSLHGHFNWRAPLQFPKTYWLLILVMVTLYGSVVPFNTIHQAFLQSKSWWYPNDPVKAAQVMGVPDTMSALLVPFVGYYTDRYGYRPQTLFICATVITVIHFCLGRATPTLMPSPIPALFFLGASYACLLVFWPCIPVIVSEVYLATAYGLATALLNACYFGFPMMAAALTTRDPTFTLTETMFALFGLLGMLSCVALWYFDMSENGSRLALPEISGVVRKSSNELLFIADYGDEDDPVELDVHSLSSHEEGGFISIPMVEPLVLNIKKRKGPTGSLTLSPNSSVTSDQSRAPFTEDGIPAKPDNE